MHCFKKKNTQVSACSLSVRRCVAAAYVRWYLHRRRPDSGLPHTFALESRDAEQKTIRRKGRDKLLVWIGLALGLFSWAYAAIAPELCNH
jgi:hypothetical protein